MAAPSVIQTATLTFNSTTYKLKSIPGGRPRSCDAIDVTTLSDNKKQFVPGALVQNGEISATIAGDNPPALNSKSSLSLTVGSSTVDCGQAVCREIDAVTVEAGGDRERTWTCVFQSLGADPS